jgi:hypothetical protein
MIELRLRPIVRREARMEGSANSGGPEAGLEAGEPGLRSSGITIVVLFFIRICGCFPIDMDDLPTSYLLVDGFASFLSRTVSGAFTCTRGCGPRRSTTFSFKNICLSDLVRFGEFCLLLGLDL